MPYYVCAIRKNNALGVHSDGERSTAFRTVKTSSYLGRRSPLSLIVKPRQNTQPYYNPKKWLHLIERHTIKGRWTGEHSHSADCTDTAWSSAQSEPSQSVWSWSSSWYWQQESCHWQRDRVSWCTVYTCEDSHLSNFKLNGRSRRIDCGQLRSSVNYQWIAGRSVMQAFVSCMLNSYVSLQQLCTKQLCTQLPAWPKRP